MIDASKIPEDKKSRVQFMLDEIKKPSDVEFTNEELARKLDYLEYISNPEAYYEDYGEYYSGEVENGEAYTYFLSELNDDRKEALEFYFGEIFEDDVIKFTGIESLNAYCDLGQAYQRELLKEAEKNKDINVDSKSDITSSDDAKPLDTIEIKGVKVMPTKDSKDNGDKRQIKLNVEHDGKVCVAYTTVRDSQISTTQTSYGPKTNISYTSDVKSVQLRIDTGEKTEDGKRIYTREYKTPSEVLSMHENANVKLCEKYKGISGNVSDKEAQSSQSYEV